MCSNCQQRRMVIACARAWLSRTYGVPVKASMELNNILYHNTQLNKLPTVAEASAVINSTGDLLIYPSKVLDPGSMKPGSTWRSGIIMFSTEVE